MGYRLELMDSEQTLNTIPCRVKLPLLVEIWLRKQAEERHTTKSELIRHVLNVIEETDSLDFFLSPAMSFSTTSKLIGQKAQTIERQRQEIAELRIENETLRKELAEARKTPSSTPKTPPNYTKPSESPRSIEGMSEAEIDEAYEKDQSWKYQHH